MEQQVNDIIEAFRAALRDGTTDGQSFQRSLDALQALVPVTELDRMHYLLGVVRLLDALLEIMPAEGTEPVRAQRAQTFDVLMRQYGSTDTPYIRSRTIVEDVAARLAAGEDSAQLMTEATARLEALDLDAADESARTAATLAVQSLRAAHDWVRAYDTSPDKGEMVARTLRLIATSIEIGGFDLDPLIKSAQTIRDGRLSLDGTPNGHALALMVVVGLGLRANASALPGLDPAMALLCEALADAHAAANTCSARCEAVLAELERRLQSDGFSEYALNLAIAGLKEVEPETDEDRQTLRASLLRLFDIAAPHAPPDAAQTMIITRDSILAQDAPAPPLETAAVVAEANAIIQRLRDGLAGGALIAPAVTRAMTELQALGSRIDESNEEAFKRVVALMPEVVAIAAQYAPADKSVIAEDVTDVVRQMMGEVGGATDGDAVREEIASQSVMREARQLGQLSTNDPYEQRGASPLHRQCASLLRPLMERLSAMRTLDQTRERDQAESKRISNRFDIAVQRLRAATTDEQWIEHLRGSLRRATGDLRRFERRYHLMVIEPPWSTSPVAVDANAVFFSGESTAQGTVDAACGLIGMDRPIAHGVDDPTQTRWNLLRRSAVAVFDFTSYNRSAADPPGELPRSSEKRAAVIRAAAPIARVAYECGWAFVLGLPMVTLTRPGQGLPFDIDIEPVPLQGDSDDAMRIALALQAAVLGVQREAGTEDLAPTVDRLRQLYGNDSTSAPMLASFENSHDGMHVQLGAAALLERDPRHRAMLTLPAFPPHYPRADRTPTLFHVTAFRPWSKPCEESVRDACTQAGLEYRIGYEHLDPDILRAIWQDIAGASFVVADLTNLNPNAALELAIAQALGRPTLVLSQTPDVPMHLSALAKVRVHSYTGTASGRKALSQLVQEAAGAAHS